MPQGVAFLCLKHYVKYATLSGERSEHCRLHFIITTCPALADYQIG
jgi:hypothetical protein